MNGYITAYIILILAYNSYESIPHCMRYTDTTNTVCAKCENNFNLLDGKCPCYDRNCDFCSSSYLGGCYKCKQNFILDQSSGSCILYIPYCLYFSDYGCTQCLEGYTLLSNQTCVKSTYQCADNNCVRCTSENVGSCVECKSKYYLLAGMCHYNSICYKPNLADDYNSYDMCFPLCFYNGESCINKCNMLDDDDDRDDDPESDDEQDDDRDDRDDDEYHNRCISCNKKGYAIETLNCHIQKYNMPNCAMSDTIHKDQCKRCEIGYKLILNRCIKCSIKNCLICEIRNLRDVCVSCAEGYELIDNSCYDINNYLVPNSQNCLKVAMNKDYCFECIDQYSRINGQCIQCEIENCAFCFENNKCAQCNANYVYNNISAKCEPIKYDSNTKNCVSSNNTVYCFPEGDSNYFETKTNGKALTYHSLTTKCLTSDCSQCKGDVCESLKCPLNQYYESSNGTCRRCPDNCAYCLNEYICIECSKGYGMFSDKCVRFDTNYDIDDCVEYNLYGNCLKCASKCTLKSDGTCSCKQRVLVLVFIIMFLILTCLVIFFILYRCRLMRQLRVIEIAQNNEDRIPVPEMYESKILSDKKLGLIAAKDKLLSKCDKCKKDIALYQIYPCKCKLCDIDFGDIDINGNKNEFKFNEKAFTPNVNANIFKFSFAEKGNTPNIGLTNKPEISEKGNMPNLTKNAEYPDMPENNTNINKPEITEKDKVDNNKKDDDDLDNQSEYSKITNVDKYINKKCIRCNKEIETIKKIAKKCEICFEISSQSFNFQCGCALKVCGKCYNTILKKSKICPMCRKEI